MGTCKSTLITNWEPPGEEWWANVEEKPDEPLIEARIELTLSHSEYQQLLSWIKTIENSNG